MKITIVFPKNKDVVARFEDEIFTYTRTYKDMETLAEDYTDILLYGLDGSQLRHWNFNEPEVWTEDILKNCNCIYNEDTEAGMSDELDPAWDGRIKDFAYNVRMRI